MAPTVTAAGRAREVLARLRWVSCLAWEEVAWPEFLAVAALAFAIGVEFWVNRPLRQELRGLQAHVAAATSADLARGELLAPSAPQRGGGDYVADFMAFLPATDMREQQLQTLHSLAGESGITLSRVEYGHSRLEHLPGSRMTMQLAVSAEYAPYRKFLHNLLLAMPNLSVERVTMERSPGQATRLNIRLETSLYYRNDNNNGDADRNADAGSAR